MNPSIPPHPPNMFRHPTPQIRMPPVGNAPPPPAGSQQPRISIPPMKVPRLEVSLLLSVY